MKDYEIALQTALNRYFKVLDNIEEIENLRRNKPMSLELKIKAKSLAEEARIIKQEEQK